jgi:hypothetical protein
MTQRKNNSILEELAQVRQEEALLEATGQEVLERAKIVSQSIERRVRSLTENASPHLVHPADARS